MQKIGSAGRRFLQRVTDSLRGLLTKLGLSMRAKLIIIFLLVKIIPLILVTVIAWRQIVLLGDTLKGIAVNDSADALNASAVENIERMSTDTAQRVANFLYERDVDLRYLAGTAANLGGNADAIAPVFERFAQAKTGRLVQTGEWELAADGKSWVPKADNPNLRDMTDTLGPSTNGQNNDVANGSTYHPRPADPYSYEDAPLYDEITFIGLDGMEQVKIGTTELPTSRKARYKDWFITGDTKQVSDRRNTFIHAETYWPRLQTLTQDAGSDIYVSDVIGAYVGSNYIGLYTQENVTKAASERGYAIPFMPKEQSYAGRENPNGRRFEGIVRWAMPVFADGEKIGYVTMALNHDHIMEFVDHQTPIAERYTELPSAYEGNYAFIWDYQCRAICHPRHNSIAGYDPETGLPEIPWLETSVYNELLARCGLSPEQTERMGAQAKMDTLKAAWPALIEEGATYNLIKGVPTFDDQQRPPQKTGAADLTRLGYVGLDGRYLNHAPQCTGWMDLTVHGGSGSFYILWSGVYKLNTAAAIPYYTGQYAPSAANNYSRRGFGFVAIGAGLEDFQAPAIETEKKLENAAQSNLNNTFLQLTTTTLAIIVLVVFIAIWMATYLTSNITRLIKGISRFRGGERQFRFHARIKDEFGILADSFDDMADSIVKSVNSPLSIITMDRRIIYMNDEGLRFSSATLADVVGQPYQHNSIYPANSPYDPVAALEEGRESEVYCDPSSGRHMQGTASYFLNKEGGHIGYIIVSKDVTEMVRERMELEEQRLLLAQIFSASPDLIWYMDAEGRYLAVNPRFAAIAGEPPDAFVGRQAMDMLPLDVATRFRLGDSEAAASGTPLYTEEEITFADGHTEILDSVRTPLRDKSDVLMGMLGFARNITARAAMEDQLRQTQTELRQAVSDANRANEHKGEFLARMSHEIRTPMNAIIGLINIVLRKLDEPADTPQNKEEVKGHIRQIETSSQHLLGLLNDILDISKIEAGKIELIEETVELSALAETVDTIIRPRCEEKGIAFVTDFDDFTGAAFRSDSLRLRQVLINLLGNAVKFTPECGRVAFSIRRKERRPGETLVAFSVRDTGIGVSQEAMATIFQPFEQAGGITRKYGGTGLGLAISRRIVHLLGGDITVESAPGEGSDFRFEIWLKETEAGHTDRVAFSDATDQFAGLRGLLVDDVAINRMVVMSLLEMTGMQIDEADDGLAAVQMFRDAPVGTYDIVFMDVQMPNMDGYEATAAIRALGRPDAAVPIVALTANAFKEDIDRALACGMNAHIAKPVEMDKLTGILFRFLKPKE
ncbi:MAG: PAS domain-containing protein [Oscillospiraceae bacterium]|jgi:PAS domain S-box-containing protein|nr:PAS domain-containing protein [Oscillospiraceae bacterium]